MKSVCKKVDVNEDGTYRLEIDIEDSTNVLNIIVPSAKIDVVNNEIIILEQYGEPLWKIIEKII